MKITRKIILIFLFLNIATLCFGQQIKLGDKVNTVDNILRDRIRNYYESGGSHGMETGIDIKHSNGTISEIDVWVKNGYLYDLGLDADYTIHYIMDNGLLDYISTQYDNLSVEQIKNRFNSLYNDRHRDIYYFSEDYTTYKTVTLAKNGLTIVEEISSYTTRFPPEINTLLKKMGIISRLASDEPSGNKSKIVPNHLTNNYTGVDLLSQRKFIIQPNFNTIDHAVGKILIDVIVDKQGNVISAIVKKQGTTVNDITSLKKCEEIIRDSKFTPLLTAPEVQRGTLTLVFKNN